MTKATRTDKIGISDQDREQLPEKPFEGSNENFRLVVDHVPGVIYLCRNDELFTMLYLNDVVENMLGYSVEDFMERRVSFVDLYHPEDSESVFEEVEKALQESRKFHLVYRLKHKAGHWKWIEEFGVGIERDGRIDFLEGYLHDISKRIEAQEALIASETRWRTLVENAPNSVAIFDEKGKYHYINHVAEGFDREEVLEKTVYDWVPEKHHKTIRENISRVIATKKPVRYEIEVMVPGKGSTWWSSCMGLIQTPEDSPTIMSISTDITEEKRSKEDLANAHAELEARVRDRTQQLTETNSRLNQEILDRKRAQKELEDAKEVAESASHAKGDFIASMSHELRTPLTSVLGFVGLLEGERHGEMTESQTEFVTTIRRNAEHLLSLINDILDVAKTEAGQSELKKSVVDLDELVRQCLQMIAGRALENHLEVVASPTMLGEAIVDDRKIRQIILNLLANACKFTPERGQIGVRGERKETQISITVWDTGIGIGPDHQKSIFDRFKQLDTGDSRKYSGTGLGLTLAKKFIEMHGGEIIVESKPGKGSEFTFSIPIASDL